MYMDVQLPNQKQLHCEAVSVHDPTAVAVKCQDEIPMFHKSISIFMKGRHNRSLRYNGKKKGWSCLVHTCLQDLNNTWQT